MGGLLLIGSSLMGDVKEEYIVAPLNYNGCVKVYDGGTQLNGQKVIRFYNGCPSSVYINACVVAWGGETKLYTSARSVKTNGNFTIYTFPDVDPRKVQWVADSYVPPVPALCANDKNKKS